MCCAGDPDHHHRGELNEWSKKTDTELAVHVPLLIRVPWKAASLGKRTTVKAELVDLYRTLVELSEWLRWHSAMTDA